MEKKRSSFSGKLGFVLAAAGSAVGLGNIWRFPYLAAKYGGGIFLLVYLVLAVIFGYTLMTAEVSIGRKSGQSAITAYSALDKRFGFVGIVASLVPIIITPYYCVIGGWVLKYMFAYIGGSQATLDFSNYIASTPEPMLWFVIFMAVTAIICLLGVEKGIEKVSKVMMPLLVLLIIIVAIYVLCQPGAEEGVKYYLLPNFEEFSAKTVLAAMSQMFYSMSLAMGIMITYGSYMKKEVSIETSVFQIEGFDTGIAFLAGLAIIPAVFACGQPENLKAGPSLMFVILPEVFASMPGGRFVGALFFVLVFFAALTSSISLLETIGSVYHDQFHMKSRNSLVIATVISIALGSLSVWGYSTMSNVTIMGMQFLDFFDYISNNILMPIVAILTCIFVGYIIKPDAVAEEVEISGKFRLKKLFYISIKYITPVFIIIIFVSQFVTSL